MAESDSQTEPTIMTEEYRVRLDKPELTFSAAHFITFDNGHCERLHGHNYGVVIELAGPLNEADYVVDFLALMKIAKQVTAALDHRVLLPLHHPVISVTEQDEKVTVTFDDKQWIFPAEDCVLLPLSQTTTELLARHLAQELLASLQQELNWQPTDILVQVDECAGQQGIFRAVISGGGSAAGDC